MRSWPWLWRCRPKQSSSRHLCNPPQCPHPLRRLLQQPQLPLSVQPQPPRTATLRSQRLYTCPPQEQRRPSHLRRCVSWPIYARECILGCSILHVRERSHRELQCREMADSRTMYQCHCYNPCNMTHHVSPCARSPHHPQAGWALLFIQLEFQAARVAFVCAGARTSSSEPPARASGRRPKWMQYSSALSGWSAAAAALPPGGANLGGGGLLPRQQ